jgi:hypothetical protein
LSLQFTLSWNWIAWLIWSIRNSLRFFLGISGCQIYNIALWFIVSVGWTWHFQWCRLYGAIEICLTCYIAVNRFVMHSWFINFWSLLGIHMEKTVCIISIVVVNSILCRFRLEFFSLISFLFCQFFLDNFYAWWLLS